MPRLTTSAIARPAATGGGGAGALARWPALQGAGEFVAVPVAVDCLPH